MSQKPSKEKLSLLSDGETKDMLEEGNEYDEMELLERLETLREDMEDLGVTTLAEVSKRISELHRKLDIRG